MNILFKDLGLVDYQSTWEAMRDFTINRDENTQAQIRNLRQRILFIKRMQIAGVVSFFLCVLSMLAIYLTYQLAGNWIFASSLVCLMYSLWMSVREILISVEALDFHLDGIKDNKK